MVRSTVRGSAALGSVEEVGGEQAHFLVRLHADADRVPEAGDEGARQPPRHGRCGKIERTMRIFALRAYQAPPRRVYQPAALP
jgi:hypothetical protein